MVFTDDAGVMQIGVYMVRLLTPFYITYIPIEIISGSIRGTGDSFIPTVITFLGICVLRILWILVVIPKNHTIATVSMSYPVTWVVTSVAFFVYYLRFLKKLEASNK